MGLVENVFGNYTKRNRGRIKNLVSKVNGFSEYASRLDSESAFLACTNEFRERLRDGETIDDIKVEALSIVREAIKRCLGMYPYDVQIEASLAMNENAIAEMKTGEGKTLVQILVAYLNLLEATKDADRSKWTSVHIMTSNDALAKRDADQNRKVFELLGFSCGFVPSRKSVSGYNREQIIKYLEDKRKSYECDVVYATASTIAFDYLDDNTVLESNRRINNKGYGYAIIDEVDDLLIDQAINPLRLSGNLDYTSSDYKKIIQDRTRLTMSVYAWATRYLYERRNNGLTYKIYNQYEPNKYNKINTDYAYYLDKQEVNIGENIKEDIFRGLEDNPDKEYICNLRYTALIDCIRARHSFIKDKQYKVDVEGNVGTVVLIDQNTGRKKTSNKYTNGLQEAIEAKEQYLENYHRNANKRYNIKITRPTRTKAMCTYPDFLHQYNGHVCGMTGTSDIEEFETLYNLSTYEVDSRIPSIREDHDLKVYVTKKQKWDAIIDEIIKANRKGRPVLIGTTSDKESEELSSLLKTRSITHQLLNSNTVNIENQIVANAGKFGTVTIATNMAGRGTDIKLGPGVKEVGGLLVIGTSQNKSVRIDYQLRGRTARQGLPGETMFYSSLEDELVLENYPSGMFNGLLEFSKKNPSGLVTNKSIIKAVKKAQTFKEGYDKSQRRLSEEFNKTFTEHKEVIYDIRKSILDSKPRQFLDTINKLVIALVTHLVNNENIETLKYSIGDIVDVDKCFDKDNKVFIENLRLELINRIGNNLKGVKGKEIYTYMNASKKKMLDSIDFNWVEHIKSLEDLQNTALFNTVNDPLRKYAYDANIEFAYTLLPNMLFETVMYAVNPNVDLESIIKRKSPLIEESQKIRR